MTALHSYRMYECRLDWFQIYPIQINIAVDRLTSLAMHTVLVYGTVTKYVPLKNTVEYKI